MVNYISIKLEGKKATALQLPSPSFMLLITNYTLYVITQHRHKIFNFYLLNSVLKYWFYLCSYINLYWRTLYFLYVCKVLSSILSFQGEKLLQYFLQYRPSDNELPSFGLFQNVIISPGLLEDIFTVYKSLSRLFSVFFCTLIIIRMPSSLQGFCQEICSGSHRRPLICDESLFSCILFKIFFLTVDFQQIVIGFVFSCLEVFYLLLLVSPLFPQV